MQRESCPVFPMSMPYPATAAMCCPAALPDRSAHTMPVCGRSRVRSPRLSTLRGTGSTDNTARFPRDTGCIPPPRRMQAEAFPLSALLHIPAPVRRKGTAMRRPVPPPPGNTAQTISDPCFARVPLLVLLLHSHDSRRIRRCVSNRKRTKKGPGSFKRPGESLRFHPCGAARHSRHASCSTTGESALRTTESIPFLQLCLELYASDAPIFCPLRATRRNRVFPPLSS